MTQRPIYRMPIHFGPALGPRNVPIHVNLNHQLYPKQITASITIKCNENKLASILPKGFQLLGEPVLICNFLILSEIQWLAGRAYNIFTVSTPTHFQGKQDSATGNFNLVMFESLADPIITGRGEIGANKVYANVQDPKISEDQHQYKVDWEGFTFVEAQFDELTEVQVPSKEEWNAMPPPPDFLHYKYIPKTGSWGEADVEYATRWPAHKENMSIQRIVDAKGSLKFNSATWEQLPTLQNIVNGLIDLDLGEIINSRITWSQGQGDVGDAEILK